VFVSGGGDVYEESGRGLAMGSEEMTWE